MSRSAASGDDLGHWLTPFLGVMGRSTRRRWGPLYLRGLLGPDGPKSVQPIATRLGLQGHDQLHHLVSSAKWDDDVCNVGGFTEAMKVAGWAEAHYIDLMPHNPLGPICTAATVHLSAAVPNLSHVECWETPDEDMQRQESPVFIQKSVLHRAAFQVPNGPGLGVEVDEAALARAAPFRPSEMPHLRRRDGSVTNW